MIVIFRRFLWPKGRKKQKRLFTWSRLLFRALICKPFATNCMATPRVKQPSDLISITDLKRTFCGCALFLLLSSSTFAADANRLTYLDDTDPFYVQFQFPRLATPQWVGESGVETVVVLAVDDMRTPAPYETFLRPILERLKQIDGRAPVSILCNKLDPQQAQY